VGLRALFVASLPLVALLVGCYQSHERGVSATADGGVRDAAPIDAAVACYEESLPPYAGSPCSDAVIACHRACPAADDDCHDACLDEQCEACIYGTIFPCANELGCEPRWREFACCVESVPGCGDLRGFDRTRCAPSCPMRFEPYATCIEGTGSECYLLAARVCGLGP
jgi:hypothetical protein